MYILHILVLRDLFWSDIILLFYNRCIVSFMLANKIRAQTSCLLYNLLHSSDFELELKASVGGVKMTMSGH